MCVKSFVKASFFAVSLIALPCILSAQDLQIKSITVSDGNSYVVCNNSLIRLQGNSDHALAPGERVRLDIVVQNISGMEIPVGDSNYGDSIYAVLDSTDPSVNVYSTDCRLWPGNPQYPPVSGARYSAPVASGGQSTNFDPFIVEIPQGQSCGEYINFKITFYYCFTLESGHCMSPNNETHYFSLPVFSLDKPFSADPEEELFLSSNTHTYSSTATNGRSLGIFYTQSDNDMGLFFSELNLDGKAMKGPAKNWESGFTGQSSSAIWNNFEARYQLMCPTWSNTLMIINGDSAALTPAYISLSGLLDSTNLVPASLYDTETFADDSALALVTGTDQYYVKHTYLLRFQPESPYSLNGYATLEHPSSYCDLYYTDLGYLPKEQGDTGTDGVGGYNVFSDASKNWTEDAFNGMWLKDFYGSYFRIIDTHQSYLEVYGNPASGAYEISSPACYYAAIEFHGSSCDFIRIYCINAENMYQAPAYYDLPISVTGGGSDEYAFPSLYVDREHRRVFLAYWSNNAAGSILLSMFDESIIGGPIYSGYQMTYPETGWSSRIPVLSQGCGGKLLLANKDKNLGNGSGVSSRIKVSSYDIFNLIIGNMVPLHSEYVSAEWAQQENISILETGEKFYTLWDDTRGNDAMGGYSLHMSEIRCNDTNSPYNTDKDDDHIISQAYEPSMHPSLACRDSDCLAVWLNTELNPDNNDVYGNILNLDGTGTSEFSTWPLTTEHALTSYARSTVQTHNNNYEVFWRNETAINKYVYENYHYWQPLVALNDASPEFLDVKPCSMDSDVLLLKQWKDGDNTWDLYVEKCSEPWGSCQELNLTGYADASVELVSGNISVAENLAFPIVVMWMERDTSGDTRETRLKVVYLNTSLIASGPAQTLKYWDTSPSGGYTVGEFAMAANNNLAGVIVSYRQYDGYCEMALCRFPHPAIPGNPDNTEELIKERYYQYSETPYVNPHLSWNGILFDYSWVERGGTCSQGAERLFYAGRLDECGEQLAWPVRVASPINYMLPVPMSEMNYTAVSTKKGALALYMQGAGTSDCNIYATALSFDTGDYNCSMYNAAPVVDAGGPYSIEWGDPLTLSGTVTDDTSMGDSIESVGWDVTGGTGFSIDFAGEDLTLQFSQLVEKGLLEPGERTIYLGATDSHGEESTDNATLSILDTTPPVVEVNYPSGGETLREGGNYTILWTASDNYDLDYFNLYYCTDWNGISGSWQKINTTNIPGNQFSYNWTVPGTLSSTCRIRVEAFDKGYPAVKNNSGISDENFYIVQATTSSIKTLILRSTSRLNQFYPGQAELVGEKLAQLMVNGKVTGFIVELDSIPGLSTLYDTWDGEPTSVSKANAVADAIRNYVKNLVRTDYTNVEYLVIVGDDRIVPFYRVHDATPGAYSENDYAGSVDCATATGGAICQDYYLTDNIYGDIGHQEDGDWVEYEVTTEGSNFMALPDLAIGRLVETPEQIATTIDAFITMDGQVTLDSLTTANVFVSGYDFLNDSATMINDKYDTPYAVDNLLGGAWTHDQLETALFVGLQTPTPYPYVLNSLNGHCTHYTLETPNGGPLPTTEMDTDYPGESLSGRVFYNVGCHSGLNVPSSFTNNYDLPEMMMEKGAIAYVGNTGYGWGLKHGIGYTEKLMEMITDKMLLQQMVSLGQALSQAKREYYIQDKRYDVFDEKVLFESTLYGLPMYRIVMSQSTIAAPKDFSGTAGPDHEEVNGITLDKKLIKADSSNLLPTGVTELALNFEFGPGTHQLVHTADGDYYKLNGRMNGEAGDSLQPLFIYESRLSGVVSHGVIFTGGTFTNYADFEPVIATPESSSPLVPPEPIAPICSTFIPTVNVSHPQLPSSLVSTDLTKLTVYTGYFEKYSGETTLGIETLFDTVGFSVYYSNSSDKTPPTFPSPPAEGGDYHTLTGTNCAFSVQASDAGTGLYRVLVTYSDNLSSWQSLDLVYNGSPSRWEGTLTLTKSITYFVQAVDNAGNCKVLKSNEGMSGLDPATGLPYVVGARLFGVQFLDSDSDGMPNDWETANGTNPNVADANEDPDDDGLINIQEMNNHTNPLDDDTDNDGMKDGWEVTKGLNPLANDAALDPDHDSLMNIDEYAADTNPYDADTDDDSMPDGWEVTYGLNPLVIDNGADGDFDGLDNGEEYAASTKPTVGDTDGDGDNDGSEENNGRDPNLAGDGKRITIFETLDGDDVIINWPSGSGDNGVIDGPYWIYRSTVPYHGAADELVTTPLPLEDGTTTYRDIGAAGGTETYFYTVTNSRYTAPAPTIGAIVPSSGPAGSALSIYGTNFVTGATVKIGGVLATGKVVQNASLITCTAPANSLGVKDVTVTNPNGQFVTKTGGFNYTP